MLRFDMPTIAVFLGVSVRINLRDHAPPHLHAEWKAREALFAIRTGEVIAGGLPKKIERVVQGWIGANREALLRNWDLAYSRQPTFKIKGPEGR